MTVLVYVLLFIINYVNNGEWLLGSYVIASFALIIWWIPVLICTLTKIALYYKIAICLFMLSVETLFANQVSAKALDIPNSGDNIFNVFSAIVMIIIAFYMALKQFFSDSK